MYITTPVRHMRLSHTIALAFFVIGLFMSFSGIAHGATTATLYPTSDGNYTQWTPNAGATHYTQVDETTCNGNTDYVSEATAGERDSFGVSLSTVPNGATITQIAITPCASRNSNGGGSATMNVFYRYNDIDSADAGAYTLTGTTPSLLSVTNFSGLSIMKSGSDMLEVGVVYSGGTKGARLSRVATVITYTLPSIPEAPTAASVANISGTRNDLSWTDNSLYEDGFKVERSTNGGVYTQIATTSANTTSFSDTAATADNTYTYRVRSYNISGNSSYSTSNYVITATVVPSDPTSLTASNATTSSQALLNWTHSGNNEDGFKIERSTDNVNFTEIGTSARNVLFFNDSGLTTGTYYYQVRAYNGVGNSGYTNVSSVVVP